MPSTLPCKNSPLNPREARPALSAKREAEVVATLREILDEEQR